MPRLFAIASQLYMYMYTFDFQKLNMVFRRATPIESIMLKVSPCIINIIIYIPTLVLQ